MKIEEILIVCHDNVCFGIPTEAIGQILRVPEMTVLALSPNEVHGMCAVGGNITTAVDLNMLLGMRKADVTSAKSRILTLNGEFDASALVVSEVIASVVIDEGRIEYIRDTKDPIVAIYHHDSELIQVVDVKRVLQLVRPVSIRGNEIVEKNDNAGTVSEKSNFYTRYLLFRMGGEVYAMEIDNLREILSANQSITLLSGTGPEIMGMMALRDELVLVVDLRLQYGFEPQKGDKNRILITQFADKVLGLMIDEIIDIKEYDNKRIERFSESSETAKTAGVIHDDDHLVSLVSSDMINTIMQQNSSLLIASNTASEDVLSDVECEVVVFKLGHEEYAIAIERVAEIIDMTPVTPIAQAPETVEGVVNIRGQIVTIGSLHRRLNIAALNRADQKIIICDTPKGRMGFFVDSVSDVMGVRKDELHTEDNSRSLFSHIIHLDEGKRLILLLDLERIYG